MHQVGLSTFCEKTHMWQKLSLVRRTVDAGLYIRRIVKILDIDFFE